MAHREAARQVVERGALQGAEQGGAAEGVPEARQGPARAFAPAAAGGANAVLAAWLDSRNALPGRGRRYVVSQGREVGHDAQLELYIDDAGDVWSGGQVQTVIRGTIDW